MQQQGLETIANKHRVSLETVRELAEGLQASGGMWVQFHIPELGGAGKWRVNGTAFVGNGKNQVLNARVDAICRMLYELITQTDDHAKTVPPAQYSRPRSWWPEGWEVPTHEGKSNGVDFAYFADRKRLAIRQGVKVRYFDAGDCEIHDITFRRDMPIPTIFVETSQGRKALTDFRQVRS